MDLIDKFDKLSLNISANQKAEKTTEGWKTSQKSLNEACTYLKFFSSSAPKEKCKTTTYADQEKIYNTIMSYVNEENINSVSHQLLYIIITIF